MSIIQGIFLIGYVKVYCVKSQCREGDEVYRNGETSIIFRNLEIIDSFDKDFFDSDEKKYDLSFLNVRFSFFQAKIFFLYLFILLFSDKLWELM